MHTSDFRYHSDLSGAFDVHLYQRLVSPFTRAPQFHCHPEFEIALFRAGTGIYHVGSQRYPIESGDIFLFASNEPHYITRIDAQEKMLILNFHFTRNFVCAPAPGKCFTVAMTEFSFRPFSPCSAFTAVVIMVSTVSTSSE